MGYEDIDVDLGTFRVRGVACCFCGHGIRPTRLDPVTVDVTARDEDVSQVLSCHVRPPVSVIADAGHRLGTGACQSRSVDSPEDLQRIRAARQEAIELGYMLTVDEAINLEPPTYMAFAGPHIMGQPSMLRFLTNGTSRADAAEAGLRILREIVADRRPWPERTIGPNSH